MDFTFTEDQLMFHDSVKAFLTNEVTPERIRELWTLESGRSDDLWKQLAELGLTSMTVPEAFGGLGMSELDFILMAEECGYVALPEPLVQNVMVGVPLLNDLGDEQKHLKEEWGCRKWLVVKPDWQWDILPTFWLPMPIPRHCCCWRTVTKCMPFHGIRSISLPVSL